MELAVPRSVSVRHAGGMTQSEVTKDTTTADDPSAVVQQFFGRWSVSKADAIAAFDEFFTPDTVWENVGLVTTVGVDEAKAFAENTPPGFETMIADFKLIVAQGRYVFTERVDDFYNAAGELLASARGAGVAEVDGGRIVAMREYFIATGTPTTPDASATDG
jgi:limonene-1,2-epoxide hydrolase